MMWASHSWRNAQFQTVTIFSGTPGEIHLSLSSEKWMKPGKHLVKPTLGRQWGWKLTDFLHAKSKSTVQTFTTWSSLSLEKAEYILFIKKTTWGAKLWVYLLSWQRCDSDGDGFASVLKFSRCFHTHFFFKSLSHVSFFVTPWTVACQAPVSIGLSWQDYWSGLPFPSPGNLPQFRIELTSPALAGRFFIAEPPGKPLISNL